MKIAYTVSVIGLSLNEYYAIDYYGIYATMQTPAPLSLSSISIGMALASLIVCLDSGVQRTP